MLKILLKNSKFRSEIENFYKKYKNEIIDIFIFGSIVRGKEKPADIDILILFKNKENLEKEYELRKIIEKINLNFKIQIIPRTYKNLFDIKFLPRENILSEAYSLINNKYLSEAFGYKSYILFKYNLKKFNISKKMMFHYALTGRRKSLGILKKINGIKISEYIVLIPIENSEEFKEFLNSWKIDCMQTRVMIPEKAIRLKEIQF